MYIKNHTNKEQNEMIQYSAKNEEDMVEVNVVLLNSGKFSVSLKDLDANEVIPTMFIFDNIDDAIAKADEIIPA